MMQVKATLQKMFVFLRKKHDLAVQIKFAVRRFPESA